MEERIIELERWSEDLNGDLADALDSEARLKHELHSTTRHADAHARRLTDALHSAEAERTRHVREIYDLQDALDTEEATVQSLREENQRLRESLEGAEVALDLQRVENERLREGKGSGAAESAVTALAEQLEEAQRELEELHEDNTLLRARLRAKEEEKATLPSLPPLLSLSPTTTKGMAT